jgi:hypothetical protein
VLQELPKSQDIQESLVRKSDGDRTQKFSSLLILLGGLVLVFATAWLNRLVPEQSRFLEPLIYGLEHLGVVVVVAMVVRGTLERASQLEFVKVVNDRVKAQIEASISTSVSTIAEKSIKPLEASIRKLTEGLTYKITTLFDEPLQEMLRNSVLNPPFIRPKYTLHLKLSPLDGNPDLLEVFVGLSYEVRNVTTETAKYSIESWLDDVVQVPGVTDIKRSHFTLVAYGEKDPPRPFDIPALKREGCIEQGCGVTSIQVKDVEVEPNCSLYVVLEGEQLMRRQDHFVWNLITLTKRLDIIVELLGGLTVNNFDVFPREMHHIGHDTFRANQQWVDNTLTMTIDQVLLPYQGVEIRWSPRP